MSPLNKSVVLHTPICIAISILTYTMIVSLQNYNPTDYTNYK